jgi:Putative Actinobacterial Holin-X, holin superfamily III
MISPLDNRSIPELFGDALAQLSKLFQNEVDLARAEFSLKASEAAGAVKLIAAGAGLLIPALVLILFAIAAALMQIGFSGPGAYLCSGLGAAIIAFVLIWIGVARLSGDGLKPSITIEQIHRDTIAAKELMR